MSKPSGKKGERTWDTLNESYISGVRSRVPKINLEIWRSSSVSPFLFLFVVQPDKNVSKYRAYQPEV